MPPSTSTGTRPSSASATRTEGDGIEYGRLGWSMVILTVITLACYLIVWGFCVFLDSRSAENDTPLWVAVGIYLFVNLTTIGDD